MCQSVDGAARAGPCTVFTVGKVIPFDRGDRKGKIIRLVPTRARRGRLETMIGPKGVRALRWFARLTLVQPPKPTR
jgi:hypothetical protein